MRVTPDVALVRDVSAGLSGQPKRLPPRWLYDDTGTALFGEITRLPEYYLTEAERGLLVDHAAEIAKVSGARTVVELGSGTADKTVTLLEAFATEGLLDAFVPLDVSVEALELAAARVRARLPDVDVVPMEADFSGYLPAALDASPRMVAFLGSTIGNLYPDERRAFLDHLAASLRPGDSLLLGADLVKGADRLIAAYDDAAGITERFILNLVTVLARELGSDLLPEDVAYVPLWDARNHRMDLRLRARRAVVATIPGAGLVVQLAEGEEIHVEISTKFHLPDLVEELGSAGLETVRTFDDGDFGLVLAVRAGKRPS
jgi:L-histidine N-alpha-methyltransferase